MKLSDDTFFGYDSEVLDTKSTYVEKEIKAINSSFASKNSVKIIA